MPIQIQNLLLQNKRLQIKTLLVISLLILMSAAATIPFFYESQSLWYKFGIDKTFLRTGKIIGLCAAILLFFQFILAIKSPFLDRVIGLDRVYYLHATNAVVILILVMLHAALVLIPEGIDNLPIGWKFWPEILGASMFILLAVLTISAKLKTIIVRYHIWRQIHRPLGYLLLCGVSTHIFFVSDSFERTVPKWALLILLGSMLFYILLTKFHYYRQRGNNWQLQEIVPLNDDIVSIRLQPSSTFKYSPGQFAILSLSGSGISKEPHPFTIASSPSASDHIRFLIKKSGDWTRKIDPALINSASVLGPFGLFSYQKLDQANHLIFIAAGIGITPMLSMLQHIASNNKSSNTLQPKVTLIWSLRHKKDMFIKNEIECLKKEIKSFQLHLNYTQEKNGSRLDTAQLDKLLPSDNLQSQIYICGPVVMMTKTRKSLIELGYKKKNIHWERFAL